MVKVTLGVDSERQIIKSNLFLLGLECQQKRWYLSSTLLISPGKRQPRCFPVKRTCHAYTTCLEQETGPGPQSAVGVGSMQVWGQPANKDMRHLAKRPQSLAVSEPMLTAPSHLYQRALTHLYESSNTDSEAVSVLVASVSDTLWDQADTQTRLRVVSISNYVLAKCCLQQLAWFNGAVMSVLRGRSQPLRNRMIVISRH